MNNSPWAWVPTLYFAEGIPYFVVNVLSVTMLKRMGMPNGDLALYTSLLYLPWVIKPLWGPFVDVIKTRRWWILATQIVLSVCFASLAMSIPHKTGPEVSAFAISLILFYISALVSATHDIAADGYYMEALDSYGQSLFVGIRSTFYRISSVFGQGVLVIMAGALESRLGDIPRAWFITILFCSLLFAGITIWHVFKLPAVQTDCQTSAKRTSVKAFTTFFSKPGILVTLVFLLLYRLPESLSVKMLSPFMLDTPAQGGLGLSTAQSGLVYGTVGVIALTIGGILGGIAASRWGLRKSLWPMALSLALPCAVYLFMSMVKPPLWAVFACVAFDQFGYGFGFTAYMLYMIYFSEGEYKTSHYALCTAFMALSMMLPGLVAGYLQDWLGYTGFFVLVMGCCLATVAMTFAVRRRVDPQFGKKAPAGE